MGAAMVKVTSLGHLRQLASDSECPLDVVLVLQGGAKSSKHLFYSPLRNGRNWYLYEHNAGRYYTERQLVTQTLIEKAIQRDALYAEVGDA
jgi:predicted P-loop ATPase